MIAPIFEIVGLCVPCFGCLTGYGRLVVIAQLRIILRREPRLVTALIGFPGKDFMRMVLEFCSGQSSECGYDALRDSSLCWPMICSADDPCVPSP